MLFGRVLLAALLLLLCLELEGKLTGRRSRGRSKPKYPTHHVDPVALSYGHKRKNEPPRASAPPEPKREHAPPPKPSAPVSETVAKQNVASQQSAPSQSPGNQRPIGWNVDQNKETPVNGKDVGWNVGSAGAGQAHVPHQQQQPGFGQANQQQAAFGQASYPHQQQQPGLGQQQPAIGQASYPQQQPGFGQPHQQASYPHQQQQPGFGQQPHIPHQQASYPQQQYQPGFGQQYPHYQQQYPHYQQPGYGYGSPGGYGGYGGFGGFGGNTWSPFGGGASGFGMNNYYQKSSGGFFGKHAFRNILAGLLVWNLVRGFTSTPYHVYHYYHRPDNIPENIPVAANTIVLCDDNSTSICTPNTVALCTSNNTIMCVVTFSATAPCGINTTTACVNSTIPCSSPDDPLCANKTTQENATTISIPCLANVTVFGKVSIPEDGVTPNNVTTYNATVQLFNNASVSDGKSVFCVTTMALPDPSLANNATGAAEEVCGKEGGNSTEGCVPGVIPLSTTTTTVLPTVENTTKKENVTSEESVTKLENVTPESSTAVG